MKRLFLYLLLALIAGPVLAQRGGGSLPPTTEVSGTVLGFDPDTTVLSVRTRLGAKSFVVGPSAVIFLNTHTATAANITAGDEVTVTYRYHTGEVTRIRLFRETRVTGTVTSVTAYAITVRTARNVILTLRPDAASQVGLSGISLADRSVLVGRRITALFEPGSLLLLNMTSGTTAASGPITAIDPVAQTITIGGRRPRSLLIDPLATLRRDGETATLDTLVVGDPTRVAFIREGRNFRVLALESTTVVLPARSGSD
jgi:hypothetical protein